LDLHSRDVYKSCSEFYNDWCSGMQKEGRWSSGKLASLQIVPPGAKGLTKHGGHFESQHLQSFCYSTLRIIRFSTCRKNWRKPRCDVDNATSHLINVSCRHLFGIDRLKLSLCSDKSGLIVATLKRHGYYCRSRRVSRTARSKPCIACAGSKARCDNGQPSCSRCTVKTVECHYPCKTTSSTPSLAFTSHSVQTSVATSEKINISRDNAPATWTPGVCGEQPLGWNDSELASLGESIDWGNLNLGVADLLDDRTGMAAVHFPMSSVSQNLEIQHAMTLISMSIPSAPNIYSPRSFISRPERNPGQQGIVNLVLQTLKSYPLTIIHYNTLPPFVHPGFVDFHDEGGNTESLEICLSLMHMLGSKIRGSSKLFWKNVRWECERMREQASISILDPT
jgi:hypothetical protein